MAVLVNAAFLLISGISIGCKKVEVMQKTEYPDAETNSLSNCHQFPFLLSQGSKRFERTGENEIGVLQAVNIY